MKIFPTPEQQRRLDEFEDEERILEDRLKRVRERRREYINTRELNDKVGVK